MTRRKVMGGSAAAGATMLGCAAADSQGVGRDGAPVDPSPADPSPRGGTSADGTALDAALTRFHGTDPEFGNGLSNHGPMASEALEALGLSERIDAFSTDYASRLEPLRPGTPLSPEAFERALGTPDARGDLIATVAERLARQSPQAVLDALVPRLADGVIAAAYHGPLRAAHAYRGLQRHTSAPRVTELAHGLGYWAARYQPLVGVPGRRVQAGFGVDAALAAVPLVPKEHRQGGLIFDRFDVLETLPGFRPGYLEVLEAYDPDAASPEATFDALSLAAARQYLAVARGRNRFVFLHGITGTAAVRRLASRLPASAQQAVATQLVSSMCAVQATHGEPNRPPADEVVAPPSAEAVGAMAARAADSGDDHTIKLVEACLAEHASSGAPEFLAVAAHRLGPPR